MGRSVAHHRRLSRRSLHRGSGQLPSIPGSPQPPGSGTVYSDADPNYDVCSATEDDKTAGQTIQYFASTANPKHLPPSSIAMIGRQDQANHQYDLKDFWAAADHGDLPAVSYLKAADYQDGHAGYSDPLDEQRFLVETINHLERLPNWRSTALVIAYDDSDGWYDHRLGPIVTQSQTPLDALTGTGFCGANGAMVPNGQQARCGVGPRQPLLILSPFSKPDFVDGTFTTQSSVVRFIEDKWLAGQRIGNGSADAWSGTLANMLDFSKRDEPRLFLDPATGEPGSDGPNPG